MSEYILLNALIIALPLVLSFENKIKYYRQLPYLFIAILITGGIYIVWDVLATIRGDWSFNPDYVGGVSLFGLPIEEVLFFITVPYASIFLYETAKYYLPEKEIDFKKIHSLIIALILLVIGVLSFNKYYSFTVMIFTASFLIVASIILPSIFRSRIYWYWLAVMLIPFLIVNYILTSLPIVSYSQKAIWGYRLATIPLEDIFYSFSLLSLNLLVYSMVKEKWLAKRFQ